MNFFKTIYFSTLTAYSSVLFNSSPYLGFLIFLATLFNPPAALTGFLGILFSNLLAIALGVHEERVKKGLYGFNGLLVGLSVSLYHNVDWNLILILFAAIVLLVFLTLAMEYAFSYFLALPTLSIPFVLVSIIIYFSFYDYHGFISRQPYVFPYDSYFPEIPYYASYYIKSLGGIFFQSSPWAGLTIAIILFASSRIAFLLSIIGFATGMLFHITLHGNVGDLSAGSVGFNYILSAIAVGGIFLIPTPSTFILAILAAMVSALIASFTKVFFVQFNIPVLALPFTTVTLLFVYATRLLRNKKFISVDFLPGSPEANLDYYKTRLNRFGISGLYIRLPFSGKWKISQGYNGKYTHKDSWKESLDFMATDSEGAIRKGKENTLEDFYTYGLTVLSPSAGRVVKVIKHLEDNKPGDVDTKNNWGNLVLIEHAPFVYSQISHLLKNSISVKEGDYIGAGTKIGLAGNSGRSLEPHIHLHFQSTPELGSSTIPISFTQYQKESNSKTFIHFNDIPLEDEVVSNLQSDFNLKTFFSLPPGDEYTISLSKNNKVSTEKWKVNLDLLGNRFLEDEKNNRVYFYSSLDYFSCLDYIGKKNTGLFFFYLASYRVPFINIASNWKDKMSYKYFSIFFVRLFKDLLHPFSDSVGFEWQGEMIEKDSNLCLKVKILQNTEKKLYELELNPEGSAPGIISINNQEGDKWILTKSGV
jgi:urea transporter